MVRYHQEVLVNGNWEHLSMGEIRDNDVLFHRGMTLGMKGKIGNVVTEMDYAFCVGKEEKVLFNIDEMYKLRDFLMREERVSFDKLFGHWLFDSFPNLEETLPQEVGNNVIKSFRLVYWLM